MVSYRNINNKTKNVLILSLELGEKLIIIYYQIKYSNGSNYITTQ